MLDSLYKQSDAPKQLVKLHALAPLLIGSPIVLFLLASFSDPGTITAKLSQSITPDVDNATAAGLAASLLVQVVLMTIKLSSRANPAPGEHMCPSELGQPIPVQSTTLQNSCDA